MNCQTNSFEATGSADRQTDRQTDRGNTNPLKNNQHYIAHAGGCIEGYIYTNSLEAVENALSYDVNYIELDLDITSDSLLIATHGRDGLDTLITKGRPSICEFKKAKIYDKFTTLSYLDIDSVMNANPNLNLVTDKISDPNIIDRYFAKYKERVWVECFCDEDYFALEDMGYHVLRTGWPPTKTAKWAHLLKRFSYRDFRVRNYTFAGADNIDFLKSDGDCFAIFGGANITMVKADSIFQRDERIRFVYVDFLE